MRNVTISLNDEVAQWARVWAAKQNTSISQLLINAVYCGGGRRKKMAIKLLCSSLLRELPKS